MNNSGAYQLLIYLSKSTQIKIGALGKFDFKKGYYVYTGSALKNLNQRIERYKSLKEGNGNYKIRWHIDYLITSPYAKIVDIRKYYSNVKIECKINQNILLNSETSVPVKKFGSSDCKLCPAHLVFTNRSDKFQTMSK